MKLFKNKVGRPTNQVLKERKIFKVCVIFFIFIFVFLVTAIFTKNDVKNSKGSVIDLVKFVVKTITKISNDAKTIINSSDNKINGENIDLYCYKYTYNVGDEIKCYTNADKSTNVISYTEDGIDEVNMNYSKNIFTLKYDTTGNKKIKISDSNYNVVAEKTISIIDTYDVALFWGQSNMVGFVGFYEDERTTKDTRDISNLVDYDIRKINSKYAKVNVNIPEGVSYEYRLYDNDGKPKERLEPITNGSTLGENLAYYNKDLYYQYWANSKYNCTKYGKDKRVDCPNYNYSLQQSKGTNMIPQFAKTYYEMTGRKLIVVFAAFDGSSISEFMPNHVGEATVNGENYTYEAMKMKWDKAIKYLENNGYNIANKFYVSMQGEENANNRTHMDISDLKKYYYNTFKEVHNNLKNSFGIKFGILNETGRKIGETSKINNAQAIHTAQEDLIKDNSDILLGSSLAYEAFINGYEEYFSNNNDNKVHLTSASLSQIGKESANSAAYKIKNIVTDQAPHVTYYSGDDSVKYYVKDGGRIDTLKIKPKTSSNWKIRISPFSNNYTGFLQSYLPSNSSLYHYVYAVDNWGNTIKKVIQIKRYLNKYYVNNSPNLKEIYNNDESVYFMLEDNDGIRKAYFYTSEDNLNQEKLYTYKYNKSGLKSINSYFSVNINDFEYKEGFYYGYIKTCDNYYNCTSERLKINKKY